MPMLRNTVRRSTLVVLTAAAALLSGCASDFPWRADWPALRTPSDQDGCPVIDGVYIDKGESAIRYVPDSSDLMLSDRLRSVGPTARGTLVRLRKTTPDELTVILLDGSGLEYRRNTLQHVQGDFECAGGLLWLRAATSVIKDGTGIARNTRRLGLTTAIDGALAGRQNTYGVAAIGWVVPMADSQDIWFRWERVGN